MAEPSAYLQRERREEGDLPEVQDAEVLKSREVKTVSLTRPAGPRGKQRRAGAAGQQAVPRCQPPSNRPSGAWSLATIVHRFLGPGRRGLGLGHPGTQRQGCQSQVVLGRPRCQPRRTRKMLLLSPALIWHWLPGEGGPEAAATAQPRPPGIFERCSWVPGGWQTWQRRVGRTPKPTTGGGGRLAKREREGAAGASGHSAAGLRRTPGAGPCPGASPPRGQAARPWAPCCEPPAWLGCSGDRGHIVPTLGPAEGQAAASTPAVLPGIPWSEPTLADALGGYAVRLESRTTGLNPALGPSGHLTPGKPRHLSRPQFPHEYTGRGSQLQPLRAAVTTQ